MPIFSRRTNQMMLDGIRNHSEFEEINEITARLNSKNTNQVIPAETELSILYSLRDFNGFLAKPKHMVSKRVPEFFIKDYIGTTNLIGEVFAVADGSIHFESTVNRFITLQKSKIYKRLKEKTIQIAGQDNSLKVFILGGFQSEFLLEAKKPMNKMLNRNKILAEEVLQQFVDDFESKVSAIILLNINEPERLNMNDPEWPDPKFSWTARCFPPDMFPQVEKLIEHLLTNLPKPLTKGTWAKKMHQGKKFEIDSRINFLSPRSIIEPSKMTLKISARALLSFLAKDITEEEFREHLDFGSLGDLFKRNLEMGRLISDLKMEKRSPHNDDDLIEFHFEKDPAVQKYS